MNIHIRNPVEFEKCLDHSFPNSVRLTRQRMTVQQLLDQQEDNNLLIKHLETYCDNFTTLLSKITTETQMVQQPLFNWVIDSEQFQTPCWLIEAIMSRVVLARLYLRRGTKEAENHGFKAANKSFKLAEKRFAESHAYAKKWKWKMPRMNYKIMKSNWHLSQVYYAKCLQHLCFVGVGIQNSSGPAVMTTLSSRALGAAAQSLSYWDTPESTEQLKVADGLRHIFRSNVQWNNAKYGHSIHTLQTYIHSLPDTFPIFKEEFEKVPFLLQERIATNNGAYFDTIEEGPDITLEEILATE